MSRNDLTEILGSIAFLALLGALVALFLFL
jgi:hypothetical protein